MALAGEFFLTSIPLARSFRFCCSHSVAFGFISLDWHFVSSHRNRWGCELRFGPHDPRDVYILPPDSSFQLVHRSVLGSHTYLSHLGFRSVVRFHPGEVWYHDQPFAHTAHAPCLQSVLQFRQNLASAPSEWLRPASS